MDDFNSETDSDYTSYWRDWVSAALLTLVNFCLVYASCCHHIIMQPFPQTPSVFLEKNVSRDHTFLVLSCYLLLHMKREYRLFSDLVMITTPMMGKTS